MAIIRYALDVTVGEDNGYTAMAWQAYIDNYGAPGSTTMCECESCGGAKSLQAHWEAAFNAVANIPANFVSAKNNLAKLVFDEATYKMILDAKDAALAAATAAFNAGIDAGVTAEEQAVLQAAVDFATAEQKAAATNYGYFATYASRLEGYNTFVEAYNKAADFVLFTAEQLEDGDFSESVLFKMFNDAAKPYFTYLYDTDTNTITVYVTSAKDSTVRTSW